MGYFQEKSGFNLIDNYQGRVSSYRGRQKEIEVIILITVTTGPLVASSKEKWLSETKKNNSPGICPNPVLVLFCVFLQQYDGGKHVFLNWSILE